MKKLLLLLITSLAFSTVTDIDGNVYETVIIGDQLWMAENLKVTHYRNGDEIPTGHSNSEWESLSTGAYAVYDDDPSNAEIYGNLYNWYSVDDNRDVCPDDWHIPTDEEWTILSDYLGGSDIVGGKMKECTEGSCPESEYWFSPNMGATNESGFTGLPGGLRDVGSGSLYLGVVGFFWSSTEFSNDDAWHRILHCEYSGIGRTIDNKRYGSSVRCIRDETDTILVPYSTGWNLVGLPLEVDNASYNYLFPESIDGTLYSFNDGYNSESELIAGEGYWLRFESAGNTTITGNSISELTISLNEGWNLITGISTPFDVIEINDPDEIIISGTIYEFTSGGYSNAEILEPGKGYWIRTNNSGSIILISE